MNSQMKEITSSSNAVFRSLKLLLTSKGIRQEKSFLVMGKKLVLEAISEQPENIVSELVSPQMTPLTQKTLRLASPLFQELDTLGTHYNLLVLRLPELPVLTDLPPVKGRELILPLGDPSNIGAVLRSASAFGVTHVYLTQESALPYLPRGVRASAGSLFHVPMSYVPSLSALSFSASDYALDLGGEDLANFISPPQYRLLIGEEGQGIPSNFHGKRLTIKTSNVESLNATVAASLALWKLSSLK